MPNTPPRLIGLTAAATFAENAVNAAPQTLDADVALSDREGNFAGGTIIVSGLLGEDRVGIRDQGMGAGQIGLAGNQVFYEGIAIGAFSGGIGGALNISLSGSVTTEAVDALIQNLTYANVSDRPTASRELVLNVTDGAGADLGSQPIPPGFAPLAGAANPFANLGTTADATPNFIDLDRDGDLDVVVGRADGQLQAFRNEGNGTFSMLTGTANPFSGVDPGNFSAPAFIDLDGDGDTDAVVGASDGQLHSFRNDGDGHFTELTGTANPFNGVDVTRYSTPGFVDFDSDGDLDAVVGQENGQLSTLRNNGNGTFSWLEGASNPYDGVDVGDFSTPGFVDFDGDGDLDTLVGQETGELSAFRNNGDGTVTWLPGETNPFNGWDAGGYSAPAFGDLDGDGDADALLGNQAGPIKVFENITPHGQAIIVNVTAADDAPTLAGLAGDVSFLENDVNAAPQRLDADVDFADPDSGFDGGFLVVSGLLVEDRLAIRNEGNAPGQIGLAGTNVTYGGIVIGSVFGGFGDTLAVFFNAAATSEAIDALIQNLTYANVSDTPEPSRSLVLGVATGDSAYVEQSIIVHVAPGNETPVLADLAPSATFVEGAAPALLDADVTFTDVDGNVGGGMLIVSSLLAEDRVGIRNQGVGQDEIGVSGNAISYEGIVIGTAAGGIGSTLTVTFNEAASVEAVDALIQNLTYANASYAPTASHELVLNVRDGDGAWLGGQARFAQLSGAANPFGGLGDAFSPSPSFVDLDRDGDMDAVIGIDPGTVRAFRNDGGRFTELTGTANPFNGVDVGRCAAPSFSDLDGDGDMDAVIGAEDGVLRSFRNNSGAFTELTGAANPFDGVDVGRFSAPAFADLDNDGDVDAVVGNEDGVVHVFRNDGGTFAELIGAAIPRRTLNDQYATPAFVDLDGDRDMDLVVGSTRGDFRAFRNDGGTFTALTGTANPFNGVDAGLFVVPGFGDVDNDGDVDAVVGDYHGPLLTFANITGQSITINATPIIETVRSAVSHTLAANVENLILTGTASINGTGNALANILTGNSGNNLLDGAGGADSMRGGLGNDVYVISEPGDMAIETDPAGGTDTVRSALSITLGANLENLILTGAGAINGTGNALNNFITGNSAANLLNGVGGADNMRGGDGDDIYVISDAGDQAIETNSAAAGGNDLVRSAISFQIGANIEALQLTGTGAINGTGNALNNVITGNNAANTLNGGVGADTMTGGLGDDLYFVDNAGDQAIELSAGGGTDLVQASASFTLGALVENLTLTGSSAINGTGNALANTINGNGSDNVLDGGAGNDLINAGNGADTLWGGLGIDTLNASAGNDKVHGGLGNDIVSSGSGTDEIYFDTALNAFNNVDAITDFSSVGDTLLLDDAVFTGLATGALAAGAFRAGAAALDADDRILYDSATGHILFDADGVGGSAAILFATVNPATLVTAADFIVF